MIKYTQKENHERASSVKNFNKTSQLYLISNKYDNITIFEDSDKVPTEIEELNKAENNIDKLQNGKLTCCFIKDANNPSTGVNYYLNNLINQKTPIIPIR